MLQISFVKRPAGFHLCLTCPSWVLTSPLTSLKRLAILYTRYHNNGSMNPTDNISISGVLRVFPLEPVSATSVRQVDNLQGCSCDYEEEDPPAAKLKGELASMNRG